MHHSGKNKGITLVELIIVIAIMAILSGAIFYNINQIGYADVVKCANLIDSELSKVRLNTTSRVQNYGLYVTKQGSSYYMKAVEITFPAANASPSYEVPDSSTCTKIGSARVSISYKTSAEDPNSEIYTAIEDGTGILVYFHKNSGAFLSSYTRIRVTGGGKTATVVMAALTGKHYVE